MADDRDAFDAGLGNEHSVERIPVVHWELCLEIGILDGYGKHDGIEVRQGLRYPLPIGLG
jgi:hypothetical protein